jgi:hypothetical protein
MSWCRAPLWGPWPDFTCSFLLPENWNWKKFVLGRPLWREDGSVICSAICQWSESRRTHTHTLLSHLRLLASLSVASYDSQGWRWKYSYPPHTGREITAAHSDSLWSAKFSVITWLRPPIIEILFKKSVTLRLTVSQYVPMSSHIWF